MKYVQDSNGNCQMVPDPVDKMGAPHEHVWESFSQGAKRCKCGAMKLNRPTDDSEQRTTNLLNELRLALLEAATDYEDLLSKYGKAHGWGRIAVQHWREIADKVPTNIRTTG